MAAWLRGPVVTSDWTPLDVYLYTVEHIGVPAKTHYDIKTGQIDAA
jgi:hypothetical protein